MTRDVHHAGDGRDDPDLDDVLNEPDRGDAIFSGEAEIAGQPDQKETGEIVDTLENEKVAACRFCRIEFPEKRHAHVHHCPDRPTVSCRFCGEMFASVDDVQEHHYSCDEMHDELARKRVGKVLDDVGGRSYLIRPWYHEFKAYAKYDVGLDVYYGLNSLQKEHDFAEEGRVETSFHDADGKQWAVWFSFKSSGLEAWDNPEFRIQNVREYKIKIHPARFDEHDEAVEKATFTVSPRWPNIESEGDAADPSNPHGILGIQTTFDGSNIKFERYPRLFQRSLKALRGEQGKHYASPTFIPADDVAPENVHHSTNVTDAELYVRVQDEETGKVYAIDGPIHRISMLLAGDREGYAKSVRDDTKCEGYYHVATIGHRRAAEIVGGHSLGKEIKHYHVKNPSAVEGDGELEHPKIGVALQNSVTDETIYWDDLDRLERELDEVLLNVLDWADLPLRPDGQIYVDDAVFDVTGERRFRKLVDNPLPRIEQEQDQQVLSFVNSANETDQAIVETLVTDGGQISPSELADGLGRHIDTIYRALDRLGEIVDHEYGEVRLASKHVGQKVVGFLDGVREGVSSSLDEVADQLMRAEQVDNGESAWSRWRNLYGVELEDDEGADGRDLLRMGYKPSDKSEAHDLLRAGARYWGQLLDRKAREFAYEFQPVIELADGRRYAPQYLQRAFETG